MSAKKPSTTATWTDPDEAPELDEAFFAGTKVQSNFICTLGYGDKASIFERSPRPAFDRFNSII